MRYTDKYMIVNRMSLEKEIMGGYPNENVVAWLHE